MNGCSAWPGSSPNMTFLLGAHQTRLDGHERRLTALEEDRARWWQGLPWGQILAMAVLALLGLTGGLSPEQAKGIAADLIGKM